MTMSTQRKIVQIDGINIGSGIYIPREDLVQETINVATLQQHVVLSSPPATGKTSLLNLLYKKLDRAAGQWLSNVLEFTPATTGKSEDILSQNRAAGIQTTNLVGMGS